MCHCCKKKISFLLILNHIFKDNKQIILSMSKNEKKTKRRDFIFTASYTLGAVGVGAAIWPVTDQMNQMLL